MAIRTLGSRYLLDEQIGQGGMGVVWRGRDKVTGSPFAIKLLRSEYAADPDAVTRFVRERTVLMKFRHPAVVTVHDMIVEGDQLALVMDLVDGGDLNAYRRRNGGTLAGAEAARLAAQVCDGLAAAHAAAIVHRDLKPANVLLDAGRVKLADFGVARIVGDPSGTTTGTVLGTAAYLAPELLTGNEPSPATDMYAFGITLYELLAGAPPFAGHVAAIMHDHLQTVPSRPPGVADRLWDLLSSCLAKEPAARPAAAAMGSALRDPGLLAVLSQAAPAAPVVAMPLSAPPAVAPAVTAAEPVPAVQRPMAAPPRSFAQAPVIPLHRHPGGPGEEAPVAGEPFPAFPGPFQQPSPQSPPSVAQPRRPVPGKRRIAPGKRRIEASPVVIGTAAIVALVLVATGVMALGRFGPFASASKASAGARPSGTARVVADPGRGTASASGPSTSPSHHTGSGHAKKPAASRSHPPITPTATGSARTGGGTGGSGGSGGTGGSGGGRPLVPYGPNLVTDGDFSDPTLSAWNYAVYQALLSPGAGVSGQNAVVLTATPEAGIAETISGLQPGGHYLLTGWIQATASPIYIGARDDASGKEVDVSAEPASWEKLSLDFTVPSGQTSAVVFCVQRRGGSGYCSNISVHALHAG
ncbi:MAG: protein kinase [Streptosporangiaceae bacterium]|nr:protein kinase [Streptosporangiaceae bacterium]